MNKKGFTLVELLVVLLIIAVLAAIETPLYLQNAQRARASEAVATLSLIRQALRDNRVNTNLYFEIDPDEIQNPLPLTIAGDGSRTPDDAGVNVDAGIAQYYSNAAYSVAAGNTSGVPTDATFSGPAVQDFLIYADGSASVQCVSGGVETNCAVKATQVNGSSGDAIDVKMDNTGRIFVRYGDLASWEAY